MVLPFKVLVLPHRKHHFRQGVTIGIDMFWPYEMLIKEILASFQYSETASQKSSIKATVLKVQAAHFTRSMAFLSSIYYQTKYVHNLQN